MSRPALAASRSFDIISFLGQVPGGAFTLSQISRAVGINAASCHAILNELADRGYLARNAALKSFMLGPSLVAMGNAALLSQPSVALARTIAEDIAREHGVPVGLTRLIGNEVLGIFEIPGDGKAGFGVYPGLRIPLAPPVGAPFLAWASDQAVSAWIGRKEGIDSKGVARLHDALALVRKRGFQVLLRSPSSAYFPKLISELASGRDRSDSKGRLVNLFNSIDDSLIQLEAMDDETLYDVTLVAAPIFDRAGNAVYNLCIGDLAAKITGGMIQQHAERLLRACVRIMRDTKVE
jgi:DNA-binding IclR family transcriptional regulator